MFTTERRARILWGQAFLLLALSVIDGCSSDDAAAGPGGSQGCQSGEDCTLWSCTCTDGTSVSLAACVLGTCQDGANACGSACESRGGV
jgi:hypothetical protein